MKSSNAILKTLCVIGIVLSPGMAFAALDLVTFKVSPQTPAPNQAVTISIQSYAVDLDSSRITWYVDGEIVLDGLAQKSIQTMTKEFDRAVTINVVIATPDGQRLDKQFLLNPLEVDLLWEADTFVPPFYKGKALPTYKSFVKLVAIPRFSSRLGDPASYTYTWTANQTQGIGQGLGRSSVLVPMRYAGSVVPVNVRVDNPAPGGKSGSVTKNITAVDPIMIFYEDAPLLGLRLDHALGREIKTTGTSFTLRAIPYFFSNDDMENGSLVYSWQKDAQKVSLGHNPHTLVLGREGGSAQASMVRLSLQNRSRILQSAAAQITVNFAQE